MNEIQEVQYDAMRIDLIELFTLLKKKIFKILFVSISMAIVFLLITTFAIPKKYSSEATIYITPRITDQGIVDYSSLQTSSILVNNYMEILKGENILSKVAKNVGLSSYGPVLNSLEVSNAENTQIISIRSTTTDPKLSQSIVKETIEVFREDMMDTLRLDNLTVINQPKVNEHPVSPNPSRNTMLGFVFGCILSCVFYFLKFVFDNHLKYREEAENYLGVPVFVAIPLEK